ncbi:hypothetical protein [Paenibacillus sp. R14(2021)]|uniref:hypothetical protein n=1 Tax=Paenibacillus sp. R14(2021) TaxID=2859228 RepID=UPI001C6127EF|nr:hypothetical protein [Paenibacillus sp. R14(2021)]
MRSVRPWVKKVLVASVIIVAVGAGLSWAAERGRPDGMPAIQFVKQESRPVDNFVGMKGEKFGPGPDIRIRQEKGMHGEGHPEHDGWDAGVAVGITILAAGLLFWAMRRGKRARRAPRANQFTAITSASDFLDQWELHQNRTKETN